MPIAICASCLKIDTTRGLTEACTSRLGGNAKDIWSSTSGQFLPKEWQLRSELQFYEDLTTRFVRQINCCIVFGPSSNIFNWRQRIISLSACWRARTFGNWNLSKDFLEKLEKPLWIRHFTDDRYVVFRFQIFWNSTWNSFWVKISWEWYQFLSGMLLSNPTLK